MMKKQRRGKDAEWWGRKRHVFVINYSTVRVIERCSFRNKPVDKVVLLSTEKLDADDKNNMLAQDATVQAGFGD